MPGDYDIIAATSNKYSFVQVNVGFLNGISLKLNQVRKDRKENFKQTAHH